MSKNNSTIKKQSKSVSRNALQIIIQELLISDADKFKLLENLRSMGITDDNDPIVKLTMVEGLLAKYNGETAEKIVHERENIEKTIAASKELFDHFFKVVLELRHGDIAELKDNIKVWNNEVIIKTQGIIDRLQNDEKKLHDKIKNEQENIYKIKSNYDDIVHKGIAVNVVSAVAWVIIFLIFLGVTYVYGYEKLEKKVIKRRELLKEYNVTPKIVIYNGKAHVLIHRSNIYDFTNGTTGAQLDTWSVVDDIW